MEKIYIQKKRCPEIVITIDNVELYHDVLSKSIKLLYLCSNINALYFFEHYKVTHK